MELGGAASEPPSNMTVGDPVKLTTIHSRQQRTLTARAWRPTVAQARQSGAPDSSWPAVEVGLMRKQYAAVPRIGASLIRPDNLPSGHTELLLRYPKFAIRRIRFQLICTGRRYSLLRHPAPMIRGKGARRLSGVRMPGALRLQESELAGVRKLTPKRTKLRLLKKRGAPGENAKQGVLPTEHFPPEKRVFLRASSLGAPSLL